MSTHELERSQRQTYFEQLSRRLGAIEAHIEVNGLEIGSQQASDWVILKGLSYDPETDALEVITEDLDHRIANPRRIYVDDGIDGLYSIEVVDDDDNRQLINLRQPLKLSH